MSQLYNINFVNLQRSAPPFCRKNVFDLLTWKLEFFVCRGKKSLPEPALLLLLLNWICVLNLNQLIDGACGQEEENQKQNVKKPKLLMVWICIWIGQKKEIRFDGTKASYNQKEWSVCGKQYGILNESCSYSIWCVLDDGETYCCLQHRLCRSTIPVRLTDDESGWILSEMVMHAHTHRE